MRLKYRDNPFFLEVSSVTTQQSVQGDLSASVKFSGAGDSLTPSAGFTYKETPTISYSPLRGDQFLKQILSPVPLEAVLILTHSSSSFLSRNENDTILGHMILLGHTCIYFFLYFALLGFALKIVLQHGHLTVGFKIHTSHREHLLYSLYVGM